jgi:DNA-directed RNA polymerase II subunit RPB7
MHPEPEGTLTFGSDLPTEMFFLKKLRHDILLEPKLLGRDMKRHVENRVREELEGVCLGMKGYVISIIDLNQNEIKAGLIDNDTGMVNVTVWYEAIIFRPFEQEVVDARVVTANNETGIISEVGPMKIFVDRRNMPEDHHFDHVNGDCWVSDDGDVDISEGSVLRMRIIGLTIGADTMSGIGTINEDGVLGQIA